MKFEDLDLSKSYTYADYLTWNFKERLELIKGKIFKMSPAPKRLHQRLSFKLSRLLDVHLDNKCQIYNAPFDVRFPQENGKSTTVVQPDICVICDKSKLDEKGCIGAPDLIIEIISSTTSKKDYKDKYELYQAEGVKEYWIADPDGFIELFVLVGSVYKNKGKFFEGDTLESTLFPELNVKLSDIFNED